MGYLYYVKTCHKDTQFIYNHQEKTYAKLRK